MNIETKFCCEDVLWYMWDNKVVEQSPIEVRVFVDRSAQTVMYRFVGTGGNSREINQKEVFKTKEELLASL